MDVQKLEFSTFSEMLSTLSSDEKCRQYLEQIRWNNNPVCPHCATEKHYKLKVKGEFKGMYKCANCLKRYTVTVGTIFEASHIGLRKWFITIHIFSTNKKGISSHQLSEDLGITQKSAWYMLSRIRHLYNQDSFNEESEISYVDETFVGGKNKNRHADKKVKNSQGRSYKDKTPVFGIIKNGQVFTKVVSDTKASTLKPLIHNLVDRGTILVSDEWKGYNGLSNDYNHKVVNHNRKEYVNDGYSTNNVENFWSHFKRGINGIYHQVSRKHLQRYADEFSFRHNNRQLVSTDRFNLSLLKSDVGRLTYKKLIE